MKTLKRIAVIALFAVAMVTWSHVALGQGTNATAGTNATPSAGGSVASISDPTMLYNSIIAFLVPIAVWGIKKITPKIPTLLLPIGATVLGAVSNWLLTEAHVLPHTSLMLGALAGAAGVGVREITDQVKQVVAGPTAPPTPPPATVIPPSIKP